MKPYGIWYHDIQFILETCICFWINRLLTFIAISNIFRPAIEYRTTFSRPSTRVCLSHHFPDAKGNWPFRANGNQRIIINSCSGILGCRMFNFDRRLMAKIVICTVLTQIDPIIQTSAVRAAAHTSHLCTTSILPIFSSSSPLHLSTHPTPKKQAQPLFLSKHPPSDRPPIVRPGTINALRPPIPLLAPDIPLRRRPIA